MPPVPMNGLTRRPSSPGAIDFGGDVGSFPSAFAVPAWRQPSKQTSGNRNVMAMLSLGCFFIDFEDAERIAFGVQEISVPASARHCKLGKGNDAAKSFDLLSHCVKTFNFDRTHKGI